MILRHRTSRAILMLANLALVLCTVHGVAGDRTGYRDDWSTELATLHPGRPIDYFLLAENIADAAQDENELSLARHLYALAAILDPVQLGQGSCLAIADLVQNEAESRRLLALATLLAQRRGHPPLVIEDTVAAASLNVAPSSLLGLSEAFSYYRRGYGTKALAVLRQSGALELVETNEVPVPGGGRRFLEDCRRYRNGDARPSIAAADVLEMLRLETALLGGEDRPWSGDLLLNDHAPLIEVDPDHLEESLGIDGRRTMYRNGRWIPAADSALQ